MSEETRVIDPETGGMKGAKPEDYWQVPPAPLGSAILAVSPFCKDPLAKELCQSVIRNWSEFASGTVPPSCLTDAVGAAAALFALANGGDQSSLFDSIARVYAFGGIKYDVGNWTKGYRWSLAISAGWRHLAQALVGNPVDDESGEPHLAHFAFHCFALHEFYILSRGTDDRLFLYHRYGVHNA